MSKTTPKHRTNPTYALVQCYRSREAAVPPTGVGNPSAGFDALPDSQMAPGGTGAWSEESHLDGDHVMPTIGVGFAFRTPIGINP